MKETKEKLISHGNRLFLEKGYNATGIQEITDHVGVSKGSFYNHFRHKETFAKAVLTDFSETLKGEYEEQLLRKTGSPTGRIKAFFRRKMKSVIQDAEFRNGCMVSNLSQEVADKSDVIAEAVDHAFQTMLEPIVSCLKEAQNEGELSTEKDIMMLGEALLNGWNGALMRVKSSRNDHALKAFEYSMEQLLK